MLTLLDTLDNKGKLTDEEEMERGSVSYQVYMFFARNMSWSVAAAIVASFVLQIILQIGATFWISIWSEAGLQNEVRILKPFIFVFNSVKNIHDLSLPFMHYLHLYFIPYKGWTTITVTTKVK